MPLFSEQRVWQRMNLNWSRCLSMAHRGFDLTEGEFLPKEMLFILDNSNDCESLMYTLIVDHGINHVKTV